MLAAESDTAATSAASAPLRAFMAAIRCAHHADTMAKLGFGCVNAFAAFDDDKIEALDVSKFQSGLPSKSRTRFIEI